MVATDVETDCGALWSTRHGIYEKNFYVDKYVVFILCDENTYKITLAATLSSDKRPVTNNNYSK